MGFTKEEVLLQSRNVNGKIIQDVLCAFYQVSMKKIGVQLRSS